MPHRENTRSRAQEGGPAMDHAEEAGGRTRVPAPTLGVRVHSSASICQSPRLEPHMMTHRRRRTTALPGARWPRNQPMALHPQTSPRDPRACPTGRNASLDQRHRQGACGAALTVLHDTVPRPARMPDAPPHDCSLASCCHFCQLPVHAAGVAAAARFGCRRGMTDHRGSRYDALVNPAGTLFP